MTPASLEKGWSPGFSANQRSRAGEGSLTFFVWQCGLLLLLLVSIVIVIIVIVVVAFVVGVAFFFCVAFFFVV